MFDELRQQIIRAKKCPARGAGQVKQRRRKLRLYCICEIQPVL
jgi:hypothetical protein